MRISIITVSYNSAASIRDTLQSIAQQDYKNIEHIIVDGQSTDGTLAIIREFPHVARFISEPDNGLYEAMNKGLRMATGDVIGILNSDDVYAGNQVLSEIAAAFKNNEAPCVYGDLQYVSNNLLKVVRTWKAGNFKRKNFYYGWMPPHPAFFARKEVYEKVGLFNTGLRSAADYEIMLRILLKHNFAAVYVPVILVKMREGGISNASLRNRLKANREDRKAWDLNNLRPYFFTLLLKPLRKVSQFIIK
jgi:glycosyltransferase involved in cell wall biosynthesis